MRSWRMPSVFSQLFYLVASAFDGTWPTSAVPSFAPCRSLVLRCRPVCWASLARTRPEASSVPFRVSVLICFIERMSPLLRSLRPLDGTSERIYLLFLSASYARVPSQYLGWRRMIPPCDFDDVHLALFDDLSAHVESSIAGI